MVLPGQPQPVAPAATAAQPTNSNVVVNQAPPVATSNRQGGRGCACSVPPDATQAVKATRWSSIAIITIHTIALLAFGFFNWAQWIASLIGIIMGSVLLCNFNKRCYTTAAVLFSIGVLFDLIATTIWLIYGLFSLATLPTLGAVACLLGAISGFMATCSWDDSGAKYVTTTQNAPVQVSAAAARSTQAATVQQNVTYPIAPKGPPPAYSHRV